MKIYTNELERVENDTQWAEYVTCKNTEVAYRDSDGTCYMIQEGQRVDITSKQFEERFVK